MTDRTGSVGLTPEDFDMLRDMADNGVQKYSKNGGGFHSPKRSEGTEVRCHSCGYEWLYTGTRSRPSCPRCDRRTQSGLNPKRDDGRGLTPPMCNAIRLAAEDGKTYREIADLFTFIDHPTTANLHAIGECSHEGGISPVPSKREPGPESLVSEKECGYLRELYADGDTVPGIAKDTGRAQSTVYRHVRGDCSHS